MIRYPLTSVLRFALTTVIAGSASGTPPAASNYVTEDGADNYVTEDGASNYVTES